MAKKPRIGGGLFGARTPTVLQLEAAECGAASLSMILSYYGRHVPLETLRSFCGVSRDGAKASSVLKAAREFGLKAKGIKAEMEHFPKVPMPAIVFVNFCHFLVVESFGRRFVTLNDPAGGRRKVSRDEFDAMFTGVVLTFEPDEHFSKSDERSNLRADLFRKTRGLRIGIAFVFIASLALVIPGIILPIMSRVFVDQILILQYDNWIVPLIAGMILTAIIRFLIFDIQRSKLVETQVKLAIKSTTELFQHILKLPISYFGTRYVGEVAARLHLTNQLASLLTSDVASVVLSLITASFFLVLMYIYSPIMTIAVAGFAVLMVIIVALATRMATESYRKLSIEEGKLNGVALAGLKDIETYKSAGTEDSLYSRWAGLNANVVSLEQEVQSKLMPINALPALLNTWTAATILVLGGFEVMKGNITIGTLVAFQSLGASFIAPVLALTGLLAKFKEIRSLTERVDDVLQSSQDKSFEGQGFTPQSLPVGSIQLDEISFGYQPLEAPLIQDLSLDVPPGGQIALVGTSGSGKSTIGRLIAGLYHPTQGAVLVGGKSILEWPRSIMASTLAYVDQDIALFEGTILDNLTLWDSSIPEKSVVRAAKDAKIHSTISSRPGTYESAVGESGGNFSGGQRQRLEIARALALNPSILVMDEATSALDAVSEAKIMKNIRKRDITLVIIAHRLSTIRDCDEIIVLEKGTVVDRGTHKQLVKNSQTYANLIEA